MERDRVTIIQDLLGSAIDASENAGELNVLADEARLLWQIIEKVVSEAKALNDDVALKVFEHPLDPGPIRAMAKSGCWQWYLGSLNRFQTAYNEHEARLSKFCTYDLMDNVTPLPRLPNLELTTADVMKMLADHQQALSDYATQLKEPYLNAIPKHKTGSKLS